MGRLIVANLLVFAVLASATALAYYGWSYTAEVSSRERAMVEDTMRELAEEKIIGIESQLLEPNRKVLERADLDHPNLKPIIDEASAPLVSTFILDADLRLIGDCCTSKRLDDEALPFQRR